MATLYGGPGNDYIDFYQYGNSNDYGYGNGGNDTLLGWNGNDTLYGEDDNDVLDGETGDDRLWGGTGVDQLWGGLGVDTFLFGVADTGDICANQADTIYDFSAEDRITLFGGAGSTDKSYDYAGNTNTPGDGQYGIWQYGGDWVVTYNSSYDNTGWHDIIVKGGDPHGHVHGVIG